jgi:hypothetical protein
MNLDRLFIGLFLGGIVTFLIAVFVFYLWAFVYFGGRAYRRLTRSHQYVPVMARVTNVLYSFRPGATTLYVKYDLGGTEIENRFLTTQQVALLAEHLKQVALRVDPDHPKDVVVDPAFRDQAAATKDLPVKQMTLSEYIWLSVSVGSIGLMGGFVLGLVLWMNQVLIHTEIDLLMLSVFMAVVMLVLVWIPYCYQAIVRKKQGLKESVEKTEAIPPA